MANDKKQESFFAKIFMTPVAEPEKKPAEETSWPLLQVGDAVNMILSNGEHFEGQISKRYDVDRYEGTFSRGHLSDPSGTIFDECKIYYLRNSRSYGLVAEIKAHYHQDNQTIVDFLYRAPAEKMRQRQYFRLPMRLSVLYKPVQDDYAAYPEMDFQEGHTLDISGGGLRMKTKMRFGVESKLACKLTIGKEILSFYAKIVREHELSYAGEYEICLGYDKINENVRNAIIKHIFAEQRKFAKKSL